MTPPGPVAERLAELLAASGRTRIPRSAVRAAFLQADPTMVGSVDARRNLAGVLAELAAAGVLEPTGRTDDGVPPLPNSVRLVRPRTDAAPAVDRGPWHHALSGAADLRRPSRVLLQVNDWLFAHASSAVEVPLRERALEITGDEKAFDGPLPGGLTPEVLRARRVVPPLHRERLPGGGPVLLVVENADTLDSLRRALAPEPGPVGGLAWGAGNAFTASVLALRDDPPATVRYFGDLDAAGLRIPRAASDLAEAHGLPPVRPATGLYRALLRHGRPASARTVDHSDVEWLDAGLRGPVRDLFAAGARLAQEAVGVTVLAGDPDWRDGLAPA